MQSYTAFINTHTKDSKPLWQVFTVNSDMQFDMLDLASLEANENSATSF